MLLLLSTQIGGLSAIVYKIFLFGANGDEFLDIGRADIAVDAPHKQPREGDVWQQVHRQAQEGHHADQDRG